MTKTPRLIRRVAQYAAQCLLVVAIVCGGLLAVPSWWGAGKSDAAGARGAAARSGTLVLTPPVGSHAPSRTVVARYRPLNLRHVRDGLGAIPSTNLSTHVSRTAALSTGTVSAANLSTHVSRPTALSTGTVSAAGTSLSQSAGTLPTSVDLSQYDPPVGDQGSVDSCIAWAVDYGLRGWYAKRDGYYPAGGSDSAGGFAPMYTHAQIVKGSDVGTTFDDNLNIQQSQGVDTRSDYSQGDLDYTTQPTPSEGANAMHYKIASWAYLPGGSSEQQSIENALAGGNPVALGLPVYSNFRLAGPTSYYVDVPTAGMVDYGNHAVFAVKYDSNGVWIQNSWGVSWGLNGYAELSWAFVNGYAWRPVTMTPISPSTGPASTSTPVPPTATSINTPIPTTIRIRGPISL